MAKKKTYSKIFIIVLVIALLSFGALTAVHYLTSGSSGEEVAKSDDEPDNNRATDDEAATEESDEKNSGDEYSEDVKEKLDNNTAEGSTGSTESQTSTSTASTLKQATPVLYDEEIDSDSIIVQGYISNVVNTEGTCTYTITQDDEAQSIYTGVLPNSNNTICEAATFSRDDVLEGEWTLTLSYKSAYAEGSVSKTITIE